MRLTKFYLAAAFFFSLLVFVPGAVAAEEVLVGGAFALTGDAATFGVPEMRGATLAVEEINSRGGIEGKPIRLQIEDTKSTNLGTVNAVTKLVTVDGLKLIIGPTWLDSFGGALPIAERNGALMITPSAETGVLKQIPGELPLIFSTFFSFRDEVEKIVELAKEEGTAPVALLTEEDPFYQMMRRTFESYAPEHGLAIAVAENFAGKESDFRSLLLKIKQSGAKSIVLGTASQGVMLAFYKQRRQLLPELPVYTTHDLDGYASARELRGLLGGVKYFVPRPPAAVFTLQYKSRFQEDPTMTASNGYDAAKILFSALRAGKSDPREAATFFRSGKHDTVTFGQSAFSRLGQLEGGELELKVAQPGR